MSYAIIDAHQHLWDPETFRYSWMEDFPGIRHRAMMDEYCTASAGVNIVQTIYVDTDVDESDLDREMALIFSLADEPDSHLGGIVAGAKLEKTEPFVHLTPWLSHPKLKGIRRVLHTQPDGLSRASVFRENMQELQRRCWSFDLCVLPHQLPVARDLVESFPDISFVLDHCGIPDVRSGVLETWSRDLKELSDLPNVVCKVSGLVTYVDSKNWSVEDLRPFFERALACFGWDRLLWGGDWPMCTLSIGLKNWVAAAVTLTGEATEEQRRKFFAENARRIYRLT